MDSIPSLGTAPVDATARQRNQTCSSRWRQDREIGSIVSWPKRAPKARTKSVAVHAGGLITDRQESRKGKLVRTLCSSDPRRAARPAIVSGSSSGPIAKERTSASARNQVDCRLANWRVRAWIRSMVWLFGGKAGEHGDHFAIADRLGGHVAERARAGLQCAALRRPSPRRRSRSTRRLIRSCKAARGRSRAQTGTPAGAGRSCSA